MAELLFGVETEYAVVGTTPTGAIDREEILQGLMEGARERLVHLPDMHSSSGVFLENGARFYADCGLHPEICTPECANPWDAVRYIQAGHRVLADLASSVAAAGSSGTEIMAFRCNVDYSGSQSTWGCHESYMHRNPQNTLQAQIVPHLITRLIYTGAGGFNPLSRGLEFTLSPRMAHFQRLVTESSTSGRGIWHDKSESLCSGYRRLHVLCGESLCSETGSFLKIGVTALIVAMADAGLTPGSAIQLADPLAALHIVAGDVTCKALLGLTDGSFRTAVAIQRHYLEQAEASLGASFMPAWAAEVCFRWRAILDQLEDAPVSVAKTLDWGIKLALYANHARSLGMRWGELPFLNHVIDQANGKTFAGDTAEDPIPIERAATPRRKTRRVVAPELLLQSHGLELEALKAVMSHRQSFFEIDTRFGQLGPKGIFETLNRDQVLDHHVNGVENIEQAVAEPPAIGRASLRGKVIKRLAGAGGAQCDWQSIVNLQDAQVLDLSDPFTQDESWHRFNPREFRDGRRPHIMANLFDFGGDFGSSDGQDSYSRRVAALECYQARDYAGAEGLLRQLVQEQYEVASSRCHLARVLTLMDRIEEARQEVNLAQEALQGCSSYVLPRMLFFKWVFTILDGVDSAAVHRQMRDALRAGGAHSDWIIQPMLDHLRPRLGESSFEFMTALARALSSYEAMSRLDEFPQWRTASRTPRRSRTGARV